MTVLVRALPALLLGLLYTGAVAQETLQDMPRYDRYEKLRREIGSSVVRGQVSATWDDDSKGFTYPKDGKFYRYDVATGKTEETTIKDKPTGRRGQGGAPERGRQFDTALSADKKLKAVSRDRNVYISDADGKNEIALTTDGGTANRVKYGIASWVYGEELVVREAMWWSPDGKKLAFYRFDEAPVKDYFLAYHQTEFQDTLDTEAYPKAGAPNPIVALLVYDLATKKTVAVNGKFDDETLGEYIYDVRWSPDGSELLYNRTNRKQNIMELCAADPSTGASRAIMRESQTQSWAENHPDVRFLKDNKTFIWSSEKGGYKNFYLCNIDGKTAPKPITKNEFDADSIVRFDEDAKSISYMARSGDNPYLVQLRTVGLDGKKDVQVTDSKLTHQITYSPDGKYFVDQQQNLTTPPTTVLRDAKGKQIAVFAESDLTKFTALGLKKAEGFTFTAADGKTTCYGSIQFPSDFDASKKYPVVVGVYGGPESGGSPENFQVPNPLTEFGFIMVAMDGRGTAGRGKAFRDAVYGKLGGVEIDDHAAGMAELAKRPYIDGKRVGIYGTSYGGYFSLMSLLRHPETYAVSCSSSSVTDWRHYDTIYTERFMGLPWENENKDGYDKGSANTYAKDLKGKLMLYYGTADNNVHPANTIMLVKYLEAAGKQYDLQVGPDRGHTGLNFNRQWEYFITHLIVRPPVDALALAYNDRQRAKKSAAR